MTNLTKSNSNSRMMLPDVNSLSIADLHKIFVVKGGNQNFLKANQLLLVTEKLVTDLNDLIQVDNRSKDVNSALQILYKISIFLSDHKNDFSAEFIARYFDLIFSVVRFYSNLPNLECRISASLTVVSTLIIEHGSVLLDMTQSIFKDRNATNANNNLSNFYLKSVSSDVSICLSSFIAIFNLFPFSVLTENLFFFKSIDFINEHSITLGDESILKSIFFRKLSNLVFINEINVKFELEISEKLIDYCFDTQFVKQTQIRSNTIEILSETFRNHKRFCQDCKQNHLCPLIDRFLQSIFRQSWKLFGKFSFLNVFIRTFSSHLILIFEPKIDFILLQTAQEYSLSTHAMDVFISILVTDSDQSLQSIKLLVNIFHSSDPVFIDLQSIRTVICDYLVPKLYRENAERILDVLRESIAYLDQTNSSINKLIGCCVHQVLFVNCRQKIDRVEVQSILDQVLDDRFFDRAVVDNDESTRMQLFSILSKQVSRQKSTRNTQIWNQIYQFLINNLSGANNKLRHHFMSNFQTILSVEVLQNLNDLYAPSTLFIVKFMKFLIENLYPGASFYKRCSILVFLEMILRKLAENGMISKLFSLFCDNITILLKTLIYFFTDTFQENRFNASKSFVYIVNNISVDFQYFDCLKAIALKKSNSSNPHDCSVADTIIRTLIKTKDNQISPVDIYQDLICRLESDTDKIKLSQDLIDAATRYPMYSTLFCIRQLLEEHFQEILSNVSLSRIIKLCYRINSIIFPFIASAAPEGCLPEDLQGSVDSHFMEFHAEYLTICCWRSCREISLILGHLAAMLVDQCPDKFREIRDISEFFFTQITTVTHKGAFESLSEGFEKLCKSLWRSKFENLSDIPQQFIDKSFDILYTNEDLCSTRRSAGLPHLFLLLITSEPLIDKQSSSLNSVMKCFQSILSTADPSQSVDRKRIIHVFNILRLIYKESSLSTQIFPYTFIGVQYCVRYFTSNEWPLRNSATLLYCSLIERIFGPSKTVKCQNKFNRLNSKVFFNRYPEMYPFIIESVAKYDEYHLGLEASTKIYPLLIILARLVPETPDFNTVIYDLSNVKEKITRYIQSPVWLIRVSAAKAIAALSQGELMSFETIESLINNIILFPQNHNLIHGSIKTIRYILEDLLDNVFISEDQCSLLQYQISEIWCRLSAIILNLSDHSQCPMEFVDLFHFILNKSAKFLDKTKIIIRFQHVEFKWQTKLLLVMCNISNTSDPFLKDLIIESLHSSDYMIRKETLTGLIECPHIIETFFCKLDFTLMFNLARKKSHPSVDYLWMKSIDSFLSLIESIDHSHIFSLIKFLTELIRENMNLRTKTLCAVLELLGTSFDVIPIGVTEKVHDYISFYLNLIQQHCKYENDIEIRSSCAKSIKKSIKCLNNTDENISIIIEILLVQLNDEDVSIRQSASAYVSDVLQIDSVSNALPFYIQTTLMKQFIKNRPCKMLNLLKKAPLGFNRKDLVIEKYSVFDSEELNFYYDFLDVHSSWNLDISKSKSLFLSYSIELMLNEHNKMARQYEMALLTE